MKRHLTYIMFETILLLAYFLLAANLYVYASDAPSIAFSSNRDGDYDIYIMDIKGKNLQNLTNSPTHEFKPAFSPDGHRMAYVSSRHDGYLEIYVMNLNTKVSYRLTNHPGMTIIPHGPQTGNGLRLTPIEKRRMTSIKSNRMARIYNA